MAGNTKAAARSIRADQAAKGQWLVYNNPNQNQRIVDVGRTRDGGIKIYADYGNGGEPATLFFGADETILVQ